MAELSDDNVFWLSRTQMQTALFDEQGVRWSLPALIATHDDDEIDRVITLGVRNRLAARLVGRRVPSDVAQERRRKCRAKAKKKGKTPSQSALALCDWALFVTNLSSSMLSVSDALVLTRLRWQIELLFTLWKDHGHIDESNSLQPWRILCECYAKLVAMIVQHWILLTCVWLFPNRSLRKAAHTIRQHALHLALSFPDLDALISALYILKRCLSVGCRINKSRLSPRSFQLLLAFDEPFLLA